MTKEPDGKSVEVSASVEVKQGIDESVEEGGRRGGSTSSNADQTLDPHLNKMRADGVDITLTGIVGIPLNSGPPEPAPLTRQMSRDLEGLISPSVGMTNSSLLPTPVGGPLDGI